MLYHNILYSITYHNLTITILCPVQPRPAQQQRLERVLAVSARAVAQLELHKLARARD